MSHIAILGGSFNPPHLAHQMAALWAVSATSCQQVWLMPCHQHPFGKQLVSFEHRVAMCQLACAPFAQGTAGVTRIEEDDPVETRTLFTLRRLMKNHPDHRFSLVIGADILQEKESWYRFDEIERLVEVLVVGRSGYVGPEGAPVLPAISSTTIREALASGQDVSRWVPGGVLGYIREHGLYRG